MLPTQIIFRAVSEFDQFDSEDVSIGGPFPPISISLVDSASGLHEFKISKNLPHQHPTVLDSAVAEATMQMEHFWTVLAFVRDAVIRPTGDVFYEFSGERYRVNSPAPNMRAKLVGVARSEWFTTNKEMLCANYDLDLVKRLNFAVGLPEPIGRFISLYQLLLSVEGDKQCKVDQRILEFDPTTSRTPSERSSKTFETLYTRLRNELAHVRKTATIFSTHKEVQLHLARFECIVKSIIRKKVQ